jgi:DNA-binding CsgD family transcriptional regulator
MNKVVNEKAFLNTSLERIAAALKTGIVLLDSERQVAWIDQRTQSRLNGGLEQFVANLKGGEPHNGLSCTIYTANIKVGGEPANLCVIQETDLKDRGMDIVAAVETALADTSLFRDTIIGKLKALQQASQASPAAPQTSDLNNLTDREREVLALICEGRSDAQMGVMLHLSQNTIRNHIASLYRKIGVNRRGAAIIWARERSITAEHVIGTRRRTRPIGPQE